MDGLLSDEPSNRGSHEVSQEKSSEVRGSWYFSRKEIEENSPSRRDGIDLKKENYLRKSYCTFLQDLGMRLKVPQVTIATAILFCHRFFLRQSHAKNDRRTMATVCMFLAGKIEETPRPLKDVILVSYEIIHKKDSAAAQRIKQKEVYEQQKEIILLGERAVLATLGFDLNVHHPYKPLVEAIKKLKVAQHALAQVAWNFVNDGLRTSLCLQFKPHQTAAGAIFLAAKFLKVKLPQDGEKIWWQDFDVTPRQLEEVSNQMLELYEQNKLPPTHGSEAEGAGGGASKVTSSKPAQSRSVPDHSLADNDGIAQTQSNNHEGSETNIKTDHEGDGEINDPQQHGEDSQEGDSGKLRDKHQGNKNLSLKDSSVDQSPQDVIKKLDKEKVKAALQRRKARGDITKKADPVDELERELEDVVVPGEREKFKSERKQSPENRDELDMVKDGELEPLDGGSGICKRKAGSPLDKGVEVKQGYDHGSGYRSGSLG